MAYIEAIRGSYKKRIESNKSKKKHSGYQLKIRMHRKLLKKFKKHFTSSDILGIIDRQSGRRAETEH